MTPFPPELEALMPEPAFKLTWHDERARYTVSKPNIGDTEVFTADQVRQAILDATERAAKKCDSMNGSDYSPAQCAAAIRGGGQG